MRQVVCPISNSTDRWMQRCGRIFWIWGIYETFDWGKTKQILHFTEVIDFIPLSYCNVSHYFTVNFCVNNSFWIVWNISSINVLGKVYFLSSDWILMNCNGLKKTSTSLPWLTIKEKLCQIFPEIVEENLEIFHPWLIEVHLDRAHSVKCVFLKQPIGDLYCSTALDTFLCVWNSPFEWGVFAAPRLGVGRVWRLE